MVTNLPMIFPLFKNWLKPWFGTALRSTDKAYYVSPSGFRTIGGGDGKGNGYVHSRDRGKPYSANAITGNMTFNDSEERIVDDVKLQDIRVTSISASEDHPTTGTGIIVSKQIQVTHENNQARHSELSAHRVPENW